MTLNFYLDHKIVWSLTDATCIPAKSDVIAIPRHGVFPIDSITVLAVIGAFLDWWLCLLFTGAALWALWMSHTSNLMAKRFTQAEAEIGDEDR